MFKSFLLLLEKLGRHEVLVDGFGKIYWHRYYLFYHDRMDNPRWIDYLPNAYVHIFESEEPDGEDEHSHPWNSVSLLLKGEYAESINYSTSRKTKSLGIARVKYKDTHRLTNVAHGTTTIFMHGFRRANWRFHVKPHETLCDFCRDENNGVCYKKPQVMNFTDYLQRGEGGDTPYSKNRSVTWTLFDTAFRKKWERRRAAIEKLDIQAPANKAEGRARLRAELVRKER